MALQTRPTDADVTEFLDAVENPVRRADSHRLRDLFERISGEPAVMWGPAIVGFGLVDDWPVIAFSPRKAALTIYGVYNDYEPDPRFAQLGPHTTSKGCLYVKKLEAVDGSVLETLVGDAWAKGATR